MPASIASDDISSMHNAHVNETDGTGPMQAQAQDNNNNTNNQEARLIRRLRSELETAKLQLEKEASARKQEKREYNAAMKKFKEEQNKEVAQLLQQSREEMMAEMRAEMAALKSTVTGSKSVLEVEERSDVDLDLDDEVMSVSDFMQQNKNKNIEKVSSPLKQNKNSQVDRKSLKSNASLVKSLINNNQIKLEFNDEVDQVVEEDVLRMKDITKLKSWTFSNIDDFLTQFSGAKNLSKIGLKRFLNGDIKRRMEADGVNVEKNGEILRYLQQHRDRFKKEEKAAFMENLRLITWEEYPLTPREQIDTFFVKLRKVFDGKDITELSVGPGKIMRAIRDIIPAYLKVQEDIEDDNKYRNMEKLRELLNSRTFILRERFKLARDGKQTNVHSGTTT